jgi:hypothetical protein
MKNEDEKPSYQEMCGLPSGRSKSGLDARWCMKKIRQQRGGGKRKIKEEILEQLGKRHHREEINSQF